MLEADRVVRLSQRKDHILDLDRGFHRAFLVMDSVQDSRRVSTLDLALAAADHRSSFRNIADLDREADRIAHRTALSTLAMVLAVQIAVKIRFCERLQRKVILLSSEQAGHK